MSYYYQITSRFKKLKDEDAFKVCLNLAIEYCCLFMRKTNRSIII